jgi:indolepyruvate ferredoxin oxidoreductase alpha subunit
MRQAFPKAVFPGDIGCYTLGTSQGAVDTCVDMGGSVGLASGFFETFHQDSGSKADNEPPILAATIGASVAPSTSLEGGHSSRRLSFGGVSPQPFPEPPPSKKSTDVPILASIGDSTFFHAALPLLYDAAEKGKCFILVVMDNGTTAMTGMQPTPGSGMRAEGSSDYAISIEEAARSFGVAFVRTLDPYDIPAMIEALREAEAYLKATGKGPAVVVARHPCLLFARSGLSAPSSGKAAGASPLSASHTLGRAGKMAYSEALDLSSGCNGCRKCVKLFDCPGFFFDEKEKKIKMDEGLCVNCGLCLFVCPQKKKASGKRALSKVS